MFWRIYRCVYGWHLRLKIELRENSWWRQGSNVNILKPNKHPKERTRLHYLQKTAGNHCFKFRAKTTSWRAVCVMVPTFQQVGHYLAGPWRPFTVMLIPVHKKLQQVAEKKCHKWISYTSFFNMSCVSWFSHSLLASSQWLHAYVR